MKKLILSFAIALLSVGSVLAVPRFRELNNNNGKTTLKIEFSDSDCSRVSVIKDWKLYNDGKVYDVKKVNVKGKEGKTFVLEFKHLTEFKDCRLSFTVNGETVTMNIQDELM